MTVDLVKNTAGAASPSRSAGALSPARSTGGVPAAAANHLVARQASPTATLQATKTLLDETTAPEDEERTMAFNPTSDTQTIHNHHSHLSHELQDHVMNDDSVADLSVNPQSGLDESEIIANPVEMEQSDAPVLDESNMISGDFVENSGATDPHQSAFAAVPVSAPLSASADIAATPASSSAAPTATKTNTAPEGPRDPFLVKEQFKWLNKTIANFKKKREAYIFLSPVDPVALNIPQYFSIITHPMDVSTIEKKLNSHVYTFADEAIADFDLMFTNCLTFNGSDGSANAVSLLALNAQAWFQKEVPKMPKTYADAIAATQKKRPGRPSDAGARSSLPRTATSATAGEPGLDAPAKRRIAAASGAKKNGPEMKFCQYIHRELTKKQNFEYNWPFLAPVDPIALGIPTYFNVVKRPMDLSTMKKKLDANEYYSSADYEADFRLMLDNCYKFNSVGTDVYILGQRFEALFNSKWGEKNSFLSQHGEPRVKSSHNLDDGEETDDEAYNMQMGNLRQQLQLTQKMIDDLIESKRRERDRRRQSVAPSASTVAAASALSYYPPAATGQPAPSSYAAKAQAKAKKPSKPRGRKKRAHVSSDDERMPDADITYEQKRELSDNINILPPDKLPQVFEIIKENANLGGVDDEEIELDIDSLEKPVLWKLYLFVKKHTRPPKRAKLDDQSGEQAAIGADASSSSEAESDDSGSASD